MRICWVLAAALVLATMSSALVDVRSVVVTPLYGNTGNTLTCLYATNGTTETPSYRWYDSEDGVWYTGSATYTSTTAGYEYNCSVKFTGGGWENSSNAAQISDSCFNPFPLYFKNEEANLNLSRLLALGVNVHVEGPQALLTSHTRAAGNGSFVFAGAYYYPNASYLHMEDWLNSSWNNIMYGRTGAGTFTLEANTTDGNYVTRSLVKTTSGTAYVYSAYTLLEPLPTGTRLVAKYDMYTGAADRTIQVVVQGYDGASWVNLSTDSQTNALKTSTQNITTTKPYTQVRVGMRRQGGAAVDVYLHVYEVEMVNVSLLGYSGTLSPAYWGLADNFTSDGGYLRNLTFVEEETGASYNFSDGDTQDDSYLRSSCSIGTTSINVTDQAVGRDSLLGVSEDSRYVEAFVGYDTGDTMYRRVTAICESEYYLDEPVFISDAATYSVTAFTFTINDETDSGKWEDGWLTLKRTVPSHGLHDMHSEQWAADDTVLSYLVENREYTILLTASDCSERELGYFTANPADTTRTITISETDYNTSNMFRVGDYVSFTAWWDNATNRVYVQYNDSANDTNWFNWTVYYRSNDSTAYAGTTTSPAYLGSYTGLANRTYYVRFCLSHEADNISRCWGEGGLLRIEPNSYLGRFDYPGEIVGLHFETLSLLLALAVMVLTGLAVGPGSVGVGLVLVWAEAVVFSILGWLPLLADGSLDSPGVFILSTGGIVALATSYFMSRRGGY